MESPSPVLQLVNVNKSFEAPDGQRVQVLRDVSLEVRAGESLAIVGPSGSGKSTLLHIAGTLDRPDSGNVLLDGRDLTSLDDRGLAVVRNRQIGFVFQSHFLLPQCSAVENVLAPTLAGIADGSGTSSAEPPGERAARLLRRLGLGQRLNHRPGQLSGGERQRVAVARALMNRPRVVLADEPTGSLDQAAAQALARLLAELNREEGTTLIIVTHALDLARSALKVCRLKEGRLVPVEAGPAEP